MKHFKIAILSIIIFSAITSCLAQDATTSTHYIFKNGITTDSVAGEDSLIIDGALKLRFRDDDAGEYTLSELAAIGGSPDYGTNFQIPFMNNTTDFDYSAGLTWNNALHVDGNIFLGDLKGLYFGSDFNTSITESSADLLRFNLGGTQRLYLSGTALYPPITGGLDLGTLNYYFDDVYFNRIYINNTNTYIDFGTELQLTDLTTGTKTLAELAASGGYWSKSGANLSPTTAGDDILLNGSGERIFFDDVNTSIYWTNGTLFFSSTNDLFNFGGKIYVSSDIYGNNDVGNLGDPSAYWQYLYAQKWFVDNGTTSIQKDVSNNMTFTDAVTGTKTLAELAAGGGGSGDTIVVDSVAHMLSDSATFPFGLGANVTGDDAIMVNNAYMGGWYHEQDTLVSLKILYESYGTSASVPFIIVHADNYEASQTTIFSGTATTTLQTSTTFTTKKIPPDQKVWCEVNGSSSGTPLMILVDYEVAITR